MLMHENMSGQGETLRYDVLGALLVMFSGAGPNCFPESTLTDRLTVHIRPLAVLFQ